MDQTLLVAIGGNSLMRTGEPTSIASQRAHIAETCRALAEVVGRGWRVVVTHGNGPQVGAAMRRSEVAAADAYPLPLDVCVASTQGEIGTLLQQALSNELAARSLRRPVATLLSHVVVSSADPAFGAPSKPVGRFYSPAEADARRMSGWTLVEEPPHGYRRVVPSPEPLDIVEEPVIRALVDAGVIVIALGGGGVPVVRDERGLQAVEAVVDKDLASALLATRLGVDVFVMSTDVDYVYVDFAAPDARPLRTVTDRELHRLAREGQFPPGTMGPKIEAALQFLMTGGREAIVTSPGLLVGALEGRDTRYDVVGFTAAQIPNIAGRRYPPDLAGPLYPGGIPIFAEDDLASLVERLEVRQVVFSYSDASYTHCVRRRLRAAGTACHDAGQPQARHSRVRGADRRREESDQPAHRAVAAESRTARRGRAAPDALRRSVRTAGPTVRDAGRSAAPTVHDRGDRRVRAAHRERVRRLRRRGLRGDPREGGG
jgi:carbamate kinase